MVWLVRRKIAHSDNRASKDEKSIIKTNGNPLRDLGYRARGQAKLGLGSRTLPKNVRAFGDTQREAITGSRELDFNFPKGVLAFRRRFGQETQCSQVTADVILPVLYPCCEEPNLASPT
jgi:hypothetical protein